MPPALCCLCLRRRSGQWVGRDEVTFRNAPGGNVVNLRAKSRGLRLIEGLGNTCGMSALLVSPLGWM